MDTDSTICSSTWQENITFAPTSLQFPAGTRPTGIAPTLLVLVLPLNKDFLEPVWGS